MAQLRRKDMEKGPAAMSSVEDPNDTMSPGPLGGTYKSAQKGPQMPQLPPQGPIPFAPMPSPYPGSLTAPTSPTGLGGGGLSEMIQKLLGGLKGMGGGGGY